MEGSLIFIILMVLDIPLFIFIGKLMFGSWSDFWEAIVFWFTPDILSAFTGEYWDDVWAEAKLFVFGLICAACVYGELLFVVKLLGDSGAA